MAQTSPGPITKPAANLPKIPIPGRVLWQIFRIRLLPPLVIAGVAAAIFSQWGLQLGGGVPGIAEGIRSTIASPQPARLTELLVQPYQWVEAGQPVARIQPLDPQSNLDLLQSELQLARLRFEPSTAERNALDFERLRLESLRLKQEAAIAEINLQRTETILKRHENLRDAKLLSQETYELSLRERDVYQAEITEKRKTAAALDARLDELRNLGDPLTLNAGERIQDWLPDWQKKLLATRTNWHEITLYAPVGGVIQALNHQPGEYLPESEPLLTIASPRSDRIVGYLRQPYPVEPRIGMPVQVVTRSPRRHKFETRVIQVGAQMESITNALAFLRQGVPVDVGLPLVIEVPDQVQIRPGESVDILFLKGTPAPGFTALPDSRQPM